MTEFTYRILDLDNCIADDSRRIPLIDWRKTGNERYETYHAQCDNDQFVNRTITRSPKGEINLILTGRPAMVSPETTGWLMRHRINYAHMLMRNNGDTRRSVLVKETQLGWLFDYYSISREQITSAFDDHPEIVAMYRNYGIEATQITAHSMSAYHNPLTQETAF